MKKVLITGSVGGLFGEFVRRLIYEDKDIRVASIDKIVNPNKVEGSIYLNKSHTFHLADITDEHIMDRIFQLEKPDVVVHGAEETSGPMMKSTNLNGTRNLLFCANKYGVKRFIFRSTDKVYAPQKSENDELNKENGGIDLFENQLGKNEERSSFSISKGKPEHSVLAAQKNFPCVIVRGSNTYGPRQITPDKLIPKTVRSILKGEPIEIYGQGNELRDWIHAHDYSAALMTLLNSTETGIFNVGSGQEFSALEVVQKICTVMGKGHDLIRHVEDLRETKEFRYAMDCQKIRNLGWKPGFKFKDGVKHAVDWYLLNQNQLLMDES